jgi:hypothetical protein
MNRQNQVKNQVLAVNPPMILHDRRDGFHTEYGPYLCDYVIARVILSHFNPNVMQEGMRRLQARLGIDACAKRYGCAGMTTERTRDVRDTLAWLRKIMPEVVA